MSDRIFVTGIGIVSAVGLDSVQVLNGLKNKQSGITNIEILDTIHKNQLPAGEVKLTNSELMNIAGLNHKKSYSRTSLLGIIAAREAFTQAGGSSIDLRTGLISATTVGGMDKSENFFKDFIADRNSGRLRNIITHDCADSSEAIADELGIKDFVSTVSSACSSSANSISYGARLIRNNIIDRAIVGGCDSLTKFTINGFNSLMILDKEQCKPFDKNRMGLNIGEGAGYLVIESERTIGDRKDTIFCELRGWGNACDAFHQTASSPEGKGAYLAMKQALENSRLSSADVDYVNAHGTGTENNDLTEGIALEKIFGKDVPKISSTKSYTGHTLAAAGGIEAVISVLSLKNGIVFPNLNFNDRIDELNFSPITEVLYNKEINIVMSNSFGFGGNCSSLIFSKLS